MRMQERLGAEGSVGELAAVLAKTSDPALIEQFLQSILTPTEVMNVAARWELVKLLDRGMSQRRISEELGLSLCKITRGSRELKKKDSPVAKMLQTNEGLHQR